MRSLLGFFIALGLGLVIMASTPLPRVWRDYKARQIENDRIAVVNSLINYHQRYGQYPTIEPIKENKKVDTAYIELTTKIDKGILTKNIMDNIVEVDLKAMHDSLKKTNNCRYYMIKGNPYTAFCWKDVHKDDFTLSDKTLMYSFDNSQVSSASLTVDNKIMNKVLTVRNIPGNMTIVGGKGDLYLAKIVDRKAYKLELDSRVTEVFNITDKVIATHLKDGSTKIFSIEEVYK